MHVADNSLGRLKFRGWRCYPSVTRFATAYQAARPSPRSHPRQALCPAHREGLRRLGEALRALPWQAAPARTRGRRRRSVPVASGGRTARLGIHPESGQGRTPVPRQGSPRHRPPMARRDRPGQGRQAPARRAHHARGQGPAGRTRRHDMARRRPALRHRHAPARRAAPAGEGRRLRTPRDRGPRRQGNKDRVTMLPEHLVLPLRDQWSKARRLHDSDLAEGDGEVEMRFALGVKYPKAGRQWAWQFVFPSPSRSADPRTGVIRRHHLHPQTVQRAVHTRPDAPASPSRCPRMSCATRSPPICCNPATTSARSRNCSATRAWRRR